MSISKFITGFAKALTTGEMIRNPLKPEDYPKHMIIANILQETVANSAIAKLLDDCYDAITNLSQQNQALQAKIEGFSKHTDAEGNEIAPPQDVTPITENTGNEETNLAPEDLEAKS